MLSLGLGLAATPGLAATVTTTSDSGAGSLRQAIADAPTGDTITFTIPSLDLGCTSGVCTITLTSGELVIDKELTISGPGADQLTISGNDTSRVFFINPGAPGALTGSPAINPVVNISNLTIADGKAKGGNGGIGQCRASGGGGAAGLGGGLFINNATVSISGINFDHN